MKSHASFWYEEFFEIPMLMLYSAERPPTSLPGVPIKSVPSEQAASYSANSRIWIRRQIADAVIPYVRREMVGSTNTIIYQMYRELGIAIYNETARIMLAGILSDTRNLSTSTTRKIDSTAWLALSTQLGLSPDSVAKINQAMKDAANDYTGMTDA